MSINTSLTTDLHENKCKAFSICQLHALLKTINIIIYLHNQEFLYKTHGINMHQQTVKTIQGDVFIGDNGSGMEYGLEQHIASPDH